MTSTEMPNDSNRTASRGAPSDGDATICGTLERIAFRNADNFFTIARIRPDTGGPSVPVLAHMPQPRVGESLRVTGRWERHPRFGLQLRAETCETLLPESVDGIRGYLASGVVSRLGRRVVERLIRHFGPETLAVIESTPERLQEVKGIGPKLAARITEAWRVHHSGRLLMGFLSDNGIPAAYAAKLMQAYGEEAVSILTENPFRVAEDIPGIGFLVADRLARHQGLDKDDPRRIRVCLAYLMEQAVSEGHTCMPESRLMERLRDDFDVSEIPAGSALAEMTGDRVLISEPGWDGDEREIFPARLHEAEENIANRLRAMMEIPSDLPDLPPSGIKDTVMRQLGIHLSDEQLRAAAGAAASRVAVVSGGPGTGKTTVIRSISAAFRHRGCRVCLAAPTGRAARRLSEMTREEASTLHKLLGFNPSEGRFARGRDDPLDADVVIVDEASMVDVPLFHALISAIRLGAALVLVGDAFQLPSVGPGAVLSDLIQSGRVPVFWLEEIFRQAGESPIVLNAHRIREGRPLEFEAMEALDGSGQFVMVEAGRPADVVKVIVDLCGRIVPAGWRLDPVRDLQVLTPMHRGEAGTLHLNPILQRVLNPGTGPGAAWHGFRVGDKVMHLRNNYMKEVFNGDIGKIVSVDPGRECLAVEYDRREVLYDLGELDELTLAYAISIHKSQGSEYPAVVIPMTTQHYPLLQRNLLYTAITRARRLVVVVGTKRAVEIALGNDSPQHRRTGLVRRLSGRGIPGVD
ncbi:MAG: ATP-dependent RecD-like DNA helicase [Desulfobacterales bacterium]